MMTVVQLSGLLLALLLRFKSDNGMAVVSAQTLKEMGDKGGRCLRLTTVPPSYACYLEILGALTPWSPECLACKGTTGNSN